jgi:hypothetical protein
VPEKITSVRILEQSQLSLSIGWDDLTFMQAGGLPILNYLVVSDEADFIYSEPALNAQSLMFTKLITQPGNEGKTYRFRVAAQNELGTGPYSSEL